MMPWVMNYSVGIISEGLMLIKTPDRSLNQNEKSILNGDKA